MAPRMALPSVESNGNHDIPITQVEGGDIKEIKTSVANGIFPAVPESVPGDEKVTTTEESGSASASSEPTTKESDGKYESDDSDTDDVVLDNVKYPTDMELEKRKKKAERWTRQANLHNYLVSDRLAALEEELAAFKQEMVPLKYTKQEEIPVDEVKARFEKLPPLVAEIRRMNWKSWRVKPVKRGKEKWEHVLEYYQEPGSVLEVLTESPNSGRRQLANDGSAGQSPERLRIRGRTLMQTLDYITERDTYEKNHKTVILRPFKVLAINADKIRDHLKILEEMHSPSAESKKTSDDSGQDTTQSEPTPVWETHEALVHLRLLVQFMNEDLKPIWDIKRGLKDGTLKGVYFADLWHVFERGALICTPGPRVQVFRLLNCTGGRDVLNFNGLSDGYATNHPGSYYRKRWTSGSLSLEAYHVEYDGLQHGPVLSYFCIPRYEGKRDVSLLRVFPLSCARNYISLRENLLERGEKFLTLTEAIAHREYVGLTVADHYSDDVAEQIDSQVIVDVELALQRMPGLEPEFTAGPVLGHDPREWQEHTSNLGSCVQEGCCSNDMLLEDHCWDDYLYNNYYSVKNQTLLQPVHNGADLGEDRLLLPVSVPGFILRSRKWKKLDIELLTEVMYHNSWDDLVINEEHKDKVLALVENHSHKQVMDKIDPAENMDLVRGKGKGLILLLHGEPGVGKTSTAECVADHTRRPLFPITCGDIGDTAELVESSLESHFQLAHKWGCVLLLDEADVFLQKRNRTDLQRNAIVSVFLRTLEYYSGILFLTTNRVGSIDQAFKSRIHVSLYYPRLDLDTTLQIWENSLRRLKSQYFAQKKVKLRVKSKGILKFAEEHWNDLARPGTWPWNGRQIRNAFQTAMALAEYQYKDDVPVLTREEFEKVAEASREFDSYLQTVYVKKTHADIAKKEQIRNDLYGVKKSAIKNTASTKPPKSTKSHQSRHKKQQRREPSSEEEESEEDDEEEDEDDEEEDEEDDEDEDESDEEDPDSELDRAQAPKTSKKPMKAQSDDEEDEVDDEEEEEQEEEEVRPRKGKKTTAVKEKKAKDGSAKGKSSTKRDTSTPALRRRGTAGREEKKSSKSGGRK